MKNLKLISLLKKLKKDEVAAFSKYLKQRHSRDKIALQVFDYLRKFYPKFEPADQLEIRYAYEQIFGSPVSSPADQKKLLNTLADLYAWLKNYLIAEKARQQPLIHDILWIQVLQEKGLREEYTRKTTAFYEAMRQAPLASTSDALKNWVAAYFYRNLIGSQPLKYKPSIQQCTDLMIDCWEVQRLKMACETSMLSRINPPKTVPAKNFQQPGLHALKLVYDALFKVIDTGEIEYFDQLEIILIRYASLLDPLELKGVILYLHNFLATQRRKGTSAGLSERVHRLNLIGLQYHVFDLNGSIDTLQFANIIAIACYAREFDWASRFVQDQRQILTQKGRKEAVLLAEAEIAMAQEDFKQVVKLLEYNDFQLTIDHVRAKILWLRASYELKSDPDQIATICTHLENLILRQVSFEMYKAVLEYIKILKMLLAQKSSQRLITARIHRGKAVHYKDWLLEKVEQYKPLFAARRGPGRKLKGI